jgi:hypothetical protein
MTTTDIFDRESFPIFIRSASYIPFSKLRRFGRFPCAIAIWDLGDIRRRSETKACEQCRATAFESLKALLRAILPVVIYQNIFAVGHHPVSSVRGALH